MLAVAESVDRRGPLPDPLPPSPQAPFAYLLAIARQNAEPTLRSAEQAGVIGQLRRALRDEDDERARADAHRLLQELRRHRECTYANAHEIDEILDSAPTDGKPDTERPQPTGPRPQQLITTAAPTATPAPAARTVGAARGIPYFREPVVAVLIGLALVAAGFGIARWSGSTTTSESSYTVPPSTARPAPSLVHPDSPPDPAPSLVRPDPG